MSLHGKLYAEEANFVAMQMLNHAPRLIDRLKLRPAARRELEHFVRRTMRVLMGDREFVPRDMKRYVRPVRR